uniref:Uncharacterized protein n=1 Tax=Acrobeloides nanus TaxID=290746 RepID=A0A914ELJ9_9BILA
MKTAVIFASLLVIACAQFQGGFGGQQQRGNSGQQQSGSNGQQNEFGGQVQSGNRGQQQTGFDSQQGSSGGQQQGGNGSFPFGNVPPRPTGVFPLPIGRNGSYPPFPWFNQSGSGNVQQSGNQGGQQQQSGFQRQY